MVYFNQNSLLSELQDIVSYQYSFKYNKQQIQCLEQIVEETLHFNKQLVFNSVDKNLRLALTPEYLLQTFKLRSEVYTSIGYQGEFPDGIQGLNFDYFDTNSAILYYENNGIITATTRLIFDSNNKLPVEEQVSCTEIRNQYSRIAELSRVIVKNESVGLKQEFKYLTKGVYQICVSNNVDLIISGLKQEHHKLYSKYGGLNILEKLDCYGSFSMPCIVVSWNPYQTSAFFHRVILS